MHKKNYEAAVALIKEYDSKYEFRKPSERALAIDILVELFSRDNPKFSTDRFLKACNNANK